MRPPSCRGTRPPAVRGSRQASRARRTALFAILAFVVAGLAPITGLSPAAVAAREPGGPSPLASAVGPARVAPGEGEQLGDYDARTDPAVRGHLRRRTAAFSAEPRVQGFRSGLGREGIVAMDGLTGTPRQVARTDGFLTGPSAASPEAVVRGYLKRHAATFGLTASDIDRMTLRDDYTDIAGTHHLSFVQTVDGVTVFGNGLRGHVSEDGRLISITGSPVAGLPETTPTPRLSAAQARGAAYEDVFAEPRPAASTVRQGVTIFAAGDRAKSVVFMTPGGLRRAWQTITTPRSSQMFLHVVDAHTGRVLYRRSLVQHDQARVVGYYPGAPRGGAFRLVDLPTRWLPENSPHLAGNVAHVWSDVDDDDTVQDSEEIRRTAPRGFVFPFERFELGDQDCRRFVCTWAPPTPTSWRTNRQNSGAQLFYFLGSFHDHLEQPPIGFTREAGNFEAVDGDAVQGHDIDGGAVDDGLPDPTHVDNATMATPPDGMAPTMQMYLWRDPATPNDPWIAGHGSYDASIVYHEYTHGLSNRLVVDANGVSTLLGAQAGAMGEAWSDWYAMDRIIGQGYLRDGNAEGDVRVGHWVGAGRDQIRTQPLDCPVGSTSGTCPGTEGAGQGGYTYGDFGRIAGEPEVHADGEIWAQTLWDLRTEIGAEQAESLVTRAMELSPARPSFLDMRNSILQADTVVNDGRAHDAIWTVFAARGMGYFAGTVGSDDSSPVESFALPPEPGTPTGSLTGRVVDTESGAPVAGATVAFGGHNSGFGGDYATVTAADGSYTIEGVFAGTYPKVVARARGYDHRVRTVSISAATNRLDWELRRNWAATSGGSRVTGFNGVDSAAFGCGPAAMFDQSQSVGWSSDAEHTKEPRIDPRFVIVRLPRPVDISELTIDPSATCGDGGSASTGDYRVETSPDGSTWTVAASGHFGVEDRQATVVPLSTGTTDVRFVRYTMLGNQVADVGGECPGAYSGCEWVDSVELTVHGTPSP